MRVLTAILVLLPFLAFTQSPKVVAGPFQGHTSSNSVKVWFLGKDVQEVSYIISNLADSTDSQHGKVKANTDYCYKDECPFKLDISNLKEAATYQFELYSGKILLASRSIKTIKHYEVDDFSFLIGSCAFIGTGKDKLYKLWNSTRIFNTLAEEKEGDFMVWMGDNLYLLGNEIKSKEKTLKRYNKVRQHKKLNRFMKEKFHYAIWDDHDFGPNNCDGSFIAKDKSKEIFEQYWVNPNKPHEDGIYFNFTYGDIEIFMLDDRYNRDDASTEKIMLGAKQMQWLKDGLVNSSATFKIVVAGNQVLNQYDDHESFYQYKKERTELFTFIKDRKINGILFCSGDRHHSEILKRQEKETYPFYDFTISGLSSWRHPLRWMGKEGKNELRVSDFMLEHNYAIISISGIQHNRVFKITYKNKFGKVIQEYELNQKEISFK